jgi:predicted transcriptional regulator
MQSPSHATNTSIRLRPDTYAMLAEVAAREERKYTQILDRAIRLYTTGQLEKVT